MKLAADVQIREACADDLDRVVELRREGMGISFGAAVEFGVFDEMLDEFASREKALSEILDRDCRVLVAFCDGVAVGTAVLRADGEVGGCYCSLRGRGVGSALMRARLELARQAGMRMVWLETDDVNPGGVAHARRHGFTEVRRRPGKRIPGNFVGTYELALS